MTGNKQNILIVHNYYQIPGGEDTVVTNEMQMLKDHGHEVTLYTRNNNELKTMSKVKKLLLPFVTVFNPRTYRDIRKIIKENNIEIVHVHNTLSLISPSVYYAALSMKVPVVQTVHNFRLLCPGATFYRDGHICEDCVTKGLGCAIKHNCYRNSKTQTLACVISTKIHRMTGIYGRINYICLTEFNKEKLLNLKQIKPERVFVKPNFVVNNEEFIPAEKRENQFVFAGRLDKLKGIDILLEAWRQMGEKAPKLVVCGTGLLEDWCRKFATENKCNVEFKGLVNNKEVKRIIARSKALILPTQWYEGFPMVIIEAYSVGTPVICSDLGNCGNIVENSENGWKFVHNSIESIIHVINYCEMSDSNYDKILELFDEKYSERINYKLLSIIYGDILEKR